MFFDTDAHADGHADTRFRPAVFASVPGSAAARQEASSTRTGAYATGYAAGLRAAEGETRALRAQLRTEHARAEAHRGRELARATAALNAAAAALERRTVPVVDDAARLLSTAALELAEALLGNELLDAEHGARAALARALDGVQTHTVHAVRLNPADLAVLPADTARQADVRLVPDPTLAPGDAITEFPDGFLDARIGAALERCRAALTGEGA
jgi:flagellar assembly protein FliH